MSRRLIALVACATLLTGCGTMPGNVAVQRAQAAMAARAKADKLNPKLKRADYEAGLANGQAVSQGKLPQVKQGNMDKLSYDYGYVVGLLQGSINSFSRINGSFDVYEWKSFCYMNFNAMKDALEALKANEELAKKMAVTVGLLEGSIASFSSINGSFDVSQWKSFAYTNKKSLENALNTLKATEL